MRIATTLLLALLTTVLSAQPLNFHQLTVKDGLPHNGVIALDEDAQGRIWVATYAGLGFLEGQQFVALPTDGLPDVRVDRIHCDDAGNMWVRCFEHRQEVSRYDSVARRFVTYSHSQLSDSLLHQAVSPLLHTFADPRSSRRWTIEKHILSQTDSLHPDNNVVYTGEKAAGAGLLDESIFCLLLDRRGTLWVGSANNGLFYANTRQHSYRRIVCQPNPLVRAVLTDRQGCLWMGIGFDGLRSVAPQSRHFVAVDYPLNDSVESRRVRTLLEDSQGTLWMGTLGGLYQKPAGHNNFRKMGGQRPMQVYSLHEDEQRQLWIGADDGLYRLPVGESGAEPQLMDSTVCYALNFAADGQGLWMASDQGLYRWAEGRATIVSQMKTNVVAVDASGHLWVGTDNGLFTLTDGLQLSAVSTPADGHTVQAMLCRRDFLWCSYDQGIFCLNIYTGKTTLLNTNHNEYLMTAAYCDAQKGRLYFCGTQGIDCFLADSLDDQLRTAPEQLWLNETKVELSLMPQTDDNTSWLWLYAALVILAAAGCYTLYYYRRKHRGGSVEVTTTSSPSPTLADAATEPSDPSLQMNAQFIEQATALVQAHMSDADWTAEQMAREMAMSRSKLFTLMKETTGKGVMEFVRDIRLDYAAQKLKEGVPVSEIAYSCGFSEASSFRRSFVKKFGVTPSQYRTSES